MNSCLTGYLEAIGSTIKISSCLSLQGRTNKLVDGCYSFWQAAVFPMMQVELDKRSPTELRAPFDAKALQEFILVICQDKEKGGFRDKPEKFVYFPHFIPLCMMSGEWQSLYVLYVLIWKREIKFAG